MEEQFVDVVRKASSLLRTMQQQSAAENSRLADDLLLFFYNLNDHYRLARSKSPRFSGTLPNILKDVIYNLESNPDASFQNDRWNEFVRTFLEDLSQGKLLLSRL